MNKFETWREKQIHEKGGQLQRKAEEQLDKQLKAPMVEMYDVNGNKRNYKKPVADILKLKKEAEAPRLVFTMPDLSHIDWSN